MAGHSHWAGIKHKKQLADAQRAKAFAKLVREIEVAAREGEDPEMNPKLRVAIEKARDLKMPKENIERAIKRGAGKLAGEKLESVLYEAYGPGGSAIIIEGITDNKNRTFSEIKQILSQNKGKLVSEGSVRWMFERKGCLTLNLNSQPQDLKNKEKLEMLAIEAGADDLYWHGDLLDVYTKIEDLEKVKKKLEESRIKIDSTSLDWVPRQTIEVEEEIKKECQKLFEALDENDAVQEIYTNIKM